jgi:UDPglucose 6-dehydrogenase
MQMRLGVVGFGKVGKACTQAFRHYHEVYVNDVADIAPEKSVPLKFLAENCEAIFICVPTPASENGSANLKIIYNVIGALHSALFNGRYNPLIVLKSTVPPKTTLTLRMKFPRLRFACNPEFLRENHAYEDMMAPDRIVMGAFMTEDMNVLGKVYERWSCRKIFCDPTTAETIKYLSNAFLTTKVAFACEVAKICEIYGVDSGLVFEGMGYDKRIGRSHLDPRLGPLKKESPCLPKDLKALIKNLESHRYESRLLKEILEVGIEK